MDNLQSITYQTFEQDPVKYQKYEEVSDSLGPAG
jgi:protein arginine N-methyltransferase 5